jgi:hypothetical protein
VIAAVVSFCSLDYRFLHASIKNLEYFSDQIIFAVCDHFFDGSEENYALLGECYRSYPNCLFIEYAFSETFYYPFCLPSPHNVRHLWHGLSRLFPLYFLKPSIRYVFFIDADEIVDGSRIASWIKTEKYQEFSSPRIPSCLSSCFQESSLSP